MALDKSALSDLLDAIRAGGSMDAIREPLEFVLQALIELEAAIKIGAGRYERSGAPRSPGTVPPRTAVHEGQAGRRRKVTDNPGLTIQMQRLDTAGYAVPHRN